MVTQPAQLPTRLYLARTVRVISFNALEVDIDLGFGVRTRRRVRVEGVDQLGVPAPMQRLAYHCLVVLVGGKRLLVQIDNPRMEGSILGRVFLDERVYHNPEGMASVPGLDAERLEVGLYFNWLAGRKFDVTVVRRTLNGR